MIAPILNLLTTHSTKVFIRSESIQITYSRASQIVSYLIEKLKEKKIFRKRVLLCVENSIETQLLFLSLIHTNDVLLVNPEHNDTFVKQLCRSYNIDVVITTKDLPESVDFLSQINFSLTQPEYKYSDTVDLNPGAVFLLTSGTTGVPKCVRIPYSRLLNYGSILTSHFQIDSTDCLFNLIPFYHGYGLTRLITVISTGSSMFVPRKTSIVKIINDINFHKCTWVSLVPRIVAILARRPAYLWEGFRFATSSSSLINPAVQREFQDLTKKPIFVEYGCSEASIICSNTFQNNRIGSVGLVDAKRCKIVNGQIVVRAIWQPGSPWIETGDLGFIDNDNYLWVNGRSKEVINKNGNTIFPSEIEFVIQQFPGIDDVAAYSIDPLTDSESIGVVYVGTATVESVTKFCQKNLHPFYRPSSIKKIKNMPYRCNKLKRTDINDYVNSLKS